MNLPRFEISEVRLQQCDMPLNDVDAPLAAGLRDITRSAVGKGRARMRFAREVGLHSSDFDLESFLSLLLGYSADAQADANPEISLIDEPSAVMNVMSPPSVMAMNPNESIACAKVNVIGFA